MALLPTTSTAPSARLAGTLVFLQPGDDLPTKRGAHLHLDDDSPSAARVREQDVLQLSLAGDNVVVEIVATEKHTLMCGLIGSRRAERSHVLLPIIT